MEPLRGFKDILPDSIDKWHALENTTREVLESFGFSEMRTPILERTSLFIRSVGDTTDIVEKEMYTFKDRNNESITLRPEGTAGVVRSYVYNHLDTLPVQKFYYIGPMFRYEKPQKGRLRQFHQIGVEVFGVGEPLLDAELVYMNTVLLKELGINDYAIEINNIGCPTCRSNYIEALRSYFHRHRENLCSDCQRRLEKNPLRILDCKNNQCREVSKNAPPITEFTCNTCNTHYNGVKEALNHFDIVFKENRTMVRGLDYYTKFVFEIITNKLGAQGTISAGGRYDNLVEELGGKPTPGIGFAAGCERLIELMGEITPKTVDFYIINLGVEKYAIEIAKKLRENTPGIVHLACEKKSLKAHMKKAHKLGSRYVVIVGENEENKRSLILRDMTQSKQREYRFSEFFSKEVGKWL